MPSHKPVGPPISDERTPRDQTAKSTSFQTSGKSHRRKESRNRTRSVNTMSAAQLERKRANDREAQRTIRQRTKEHIESLERQVIELTAKGKQLDNALQENAALENQVAELRQQLVIAHHQFGFADAHSLRTPQNASFTGLAGSDSPHSSRAYSPVTPESSLQGLDWEQAQDQTSHRHPTAAAWTNLPLTSSTSAPENLAPSSFDQTLQWSADMQQQMARSVPASHPNLQQRNYPYEAQPQPQLYSQTMQECAGNNFPYQPL